MIRVCDVLVYSIAFGGGIWFLYTLNVLILLLTIIVVFIFIFLGEILKNQKELYNLINDNINWNEKSNTNDK